MTSTKALLVGVLEPSLPRRRCTFTTEHKRTLLPEAVHAGNSLSAMAQEIRKLIGGKRRERRGAM